MTPKRHYGTGRDRHDPRDLAYTIPRSLERRLPPEVDLRPACPPVYEQLHLNSCSANAIGAALWFVERRRSPRVPSPSRLFIYYNERAAEGEISINGTVSLRDGYRTVARQGFCSERMWPYEVKRYRERPPTRCYEAGCERRAVWYGRIEQTLTHLKACLAEGYPFTAGFLLYRPFESRAVKRTGVIPMPARGERELGGHAMLVVGYSDARNEFIVRNSWGSDWGRKGYGFFPYKYLLSPDLAWDFWTVRRLTR